MRNKREASGKDGNNISGSVVTGNVQMAAGDVTGGMSMVSGAGAGESLAQVLDALREARTSLSSLIGQEVEQAGTAIAIIEEEVGSASPDRSRVRMAYVKLQEIALSFGAIAGAVNGVGTALSRFGLR